MKMALYVRLAVDNDQSGSVNQAFLWAQEASQFRQAFSLNAASSDNEILEWNK